MQNKTRDIQYMKRDVQLQAGCMLVNSISFNIKEAPNESNEITKTLLQASMRDELFFFAEETLSTVTFDCAHKLDRQKLTKKIVLSHLKCLKKRQKFGVRKAKIK